MNKQSNIYVAGANGLVGSAIVRNLKSKGYTNFVLQIIHIVQILFMKIFKFRII